LGFLGFFFASDITIPLSPSIGHYREEPSGAY
jgi:hypothetical protein